MTITTEERALMQEVAEEAAQRAVSRMLTTLGVDHTKPLEVQKDFAALRELRLLTEDPEFVKDQLHLRKWRKAIDAVESKGIVASFALVIIGVALLGLVVLAAKLGFIR